MKNHYLPEQVVHLSDPFLAGTGLDTDQHRHTATAVIFNKALLSTGRYLTYVFFSHVQMSAKLFNKDMTRRPLNVSPIVRAGLGHIQRLAFVEERQPLSLSKKKKWWRAKLAE